MVKGDEVVGAQSKTIVDRFFNPNREAVLDNHPFH
jgi:hypothetical protein